jgi:hypothetical protein
LTQFFWVQTKQSGICHRGRICIYLGSTDKAHQILKEVQMYFLKTGAMTLPLQAI